MSNIILAFDTETTGFAPKIDRSPGAAVPHISDYPYIIQLSFVLYDKQKQEVITKYNEYIKIPEHVNIPDAATRVNGIDKQICNLRGVPIESAMIAFCEAYLSADCVVAHNIAFDRKMIEIEVHRNLPNHPKMLLLFNETFNDLNGIQTACTMAMGKQVCDLYVEKNGSRWKKAPKLSELHYKLFGSIPENLHDALVDTTACLDCYLYMSREPAV
jgi:DNA polymerase III epsilon subunit-like protein